MDAINLLTADHNRVRGLFTRFRSAQESGDTTTMVELAGKICEDLEVHTAIEEQIFYPAIKDLSSELTEVVDEGIQEHHVVKILMEELGEVEAGSDDWVAKMTVLMENVEHHADEEEQEMFTAVRSACETAALEDLAVRLDARKGELGAPVLEDKIDLTKEQLLALARDQEIPGRSSMDHDELAATVAPG